MKKVLELATSLERMPERILEVQLEIIDLAEDIEINSKEIESLEVDIKTAVLNATDETGKKAYTNDEARKMAFISDCKENDEHQALIQRRSELAQKMQKIRADLEMLSNHQRNLRVLIEVFTKVEMD